MARAADCESGARAVASLLAGALAFNVTTGAARVVTETWVRLHLAPAAIKNLQALFTLLGSLLLFLLLFLGMVEEVPDWITGAIHGLPELLAWLPWAWPLHLARPDLDTTSVILGGVGVLVAGALAGVLGASLTGRLLRNGLMIGGGAFQGSRAAGGVRSWKRTISDHTLASAAGPREARERKTTSGTPHAR